MNKKALKKRIDFLDAEIEELAKKINFLSYYNKDDVAIWDDTIRYIYIVGS